METGIFLHINIYLITVIMYNIVAICHAHVTINQFHTFHSYLVVTDNGNIPIPPL